MKNILFSILLLAASNNTYSAADSSHALQSYPQDRLNADLMFTVMNGDLESAKELLRKGADPSHQQIRNGKIVSNTPLTTAIQHAEHDIAALLLEKGAKAKINEPDMNIPGRYKLPLHLAIDRADLPMVKLLIENGADPRATFGRSFDAYDLIRSKLIRGHNKPVYEEMLQYITDELRKEPTDVDPIKQRELNEALYRAVETHDLANVITLIDAKADPNAKVFGGESAFEEAVIGKQHDIADYLLKHGALVNRIANIWGTEQTPLHVAADQGDAHMIQLLLAYGANPRLSDKYGDTPYTRAFKKAQAYQADSPMGKKLTSVLPVLSSQSEILRGIIVSALTKGETKHFLNLCALKTFLSQNGIKTEAVEEMLPEVAREYFLFNIGAADKGNYVNMPEWLEPYFNGNSIEDLIAHNIFPKPIGNQLLLSYRNITDLSGLEKIDRNRDAIKEILLHGNKITYVPARIFSKFYNLESIHLNNNKISKIDPHAFEGLYSLKLVNLQNNELSQEARIQIEKKLKTMYPNIEIWY